MPLGLGLKQLIQSSSPAPTGHLWMMGVSSGGTPTAYVLDPSTLATITSFSAPGGYSFAGDGLCSACIAAGYAWIAGNIGGGSAGVAVFQYSLDGSTLVNTIMLTGPGYSSSIPQLIFDGSNTIYAVGANGASNYGLISLDTGTLAVNVLEAGTGTLNAGDYDNVDALVGTVKNDEAHAMSIGVPGGGINGPIAFSGGMSYAAFTAYANGSFWYAGWPGTFAQIVVQKISPTMTTQTTITPPFPVPPGLDSISQPAIGNLKYNSMKGLIYIVYPSADGTYAYGRLDSLDPSSNVMTIINNQLPLGSTATNYVFLETSGTNLWYSDGNGHVSLINLNTGLITSTVLIGASIITGAMAYSSS